MLDDKKKIKISILGSCVTRDALEFIDNIEVENYFSRVSIISLMSEKVEKYNINVQTLNGFLERTLKDDIYKTHLTKMKNITSDFLIIDFIDERFPLLKDQYENYITCSAYMESHSNAAEYYQIKVPRLTEVNLSLWIKSIKKFVEVIKQVFPEDKIILHEAYWAGFDHNAKRNNTYLSIYYNFLKILLPKINVIKIDECSYVKNSNHKWGDAPYHYIDSYYEKFVLQFTKITKSNIQLKNNFTLNKEID